MVPAPNRQRRRVRMNSRQRNKQVEFDGAQRHHASGGEMAAAE